MLRLKRVDAIVGSLVGLEYAVLFLDFSLSRFDMYELGEKEWWLHVSKKSMLLEQEMKLNEVISQLYKDDLVYKLYQKQMAICNIH